MEHQEQINDEKEIDLKELFFALYRKKTIIILVTLIGVLSSVLVTKLFMQPKYVSSAKVYVMNRQNEDSVATSSDLSAATQLTQDAMVVMTSRSIMEQVKENLALDMPIEELIKMVDVANDNDTRILTVRVTNADPALARDIADEVVAVSTGRVEEIMGVEKMNLVESANIPSAPSSPDLKKNIMIAGAIGFILACGVIVALYLFNDKIRTEEDVKRYLGLSNIGIIPIDKEQEGKSRKKKGGKR